MQDTSETRASAGFAISQCDTLERCSIAPFFGTLSHGCLDSGIAIRVQPALGEQAILSQLTHVIAAEDIAVCIAHIASAVWQVGCRIDSLH